MEIAVIHPIGIRNAAAIATAKNRNQTGVCRSVVVTRMAAPANEVSMVHALTGYMYPLPASKLRASVPKYHEVGTLS